MRNAARTRLGQTQSVGMPKAFGDFLGGQPAVHRAQLPDVLIRF